MLVDIQLCQRTDVNLELVLSRQRIGKLLIETVDSFDDQYIIRSQGQKISVIFPLSLHKIILRHLHCFSCQKICHILVEQCHIQAFQHLIVVVAILIPRAVYPVDKVIVHRNGMRL